MRLCLCSRWDPAASSAAAGLAGRPAFDWDDVVRLAAAQRVAPLLYATLRDQAWLPPPVWRELRSAYELTAMRNARLLYELRKALAALEGAGIAALVLKGAALAEMVYDNVALRPMADVDLLLQRADVPAALRVLAASGYEIRTAEPRAGATLAYESQVALVKPGPIDAHLELHWSLLDSPHHQALLSTDWLWQTAVPARIDGHPAFMLGPEALLVHLCAHLMLHHRGEGVLWRHDVAETLVCYAGQIDWEQVLARAQVYDLILPLREVLQRVVREWRACVPAQVLERLCAWQPSGREAALFRRLTASRRPVARRFVTDILSLPRWDQRLGFAWAHLFPSPAYLRHRYRVAHRLLLPLYYPYRWYLGLRSILRGL